MISKLCYVSVLLCITIVSWSASANNLNPETKLDHTQFVEVMIGEYGVFRPSNGIDGILTEGLASCIALVLYHPETKTGLIAHFWPFKDVRASFEKIEKNLRALNIDMHGLRGFIANGRYTTVISVAEEILAETKRLGVTKIDFSIFGSKSDSGNNSSNILLNLQSGQIVQYFSGTPTLKTNAGFRIDRFLQNKQGALDITPGSL
jgi:hypothetical protein